jgi:S1-C subfamily serine protease
VEFYILSEQEYRTATVSQDVLQSIALHELNPTAHVIAITEAGASDRAGMRVGDLIEKINGHSFRNIFAADSILRSGQEGKVLQYQVIRGEKTLLLDVTPSGLRSL